MHALEYGEENCSSIEDDNKNMVSLPRFWRKPFSQKTQCMILLLHLRWYNRYGFDFSSLYILQWKIFFKFCISKLYLPSRRGCFCSQRLPRKVFKTRGKICYWEKWPQPNKLVDGYFWFRFHNYSAMTSSFSSLSLLVLTQTLGVDF